MKRVKRQRVERIISKRRKATETCFQLDYMFTGTRNEENPNEPKDPLAIQLMRVDSDTKFMLSLPVPLKGGEATIMAATKEVVRELALLGYEDVVLRTDTEPVMLAIRKNLQHVRNRQGLKTELQDGAPDQHQGLQVERYVQTIRNLAKTLLATLEQRSVKLVQMYLFTVGHFVMQHGCRIVST